MSTVREHLEAIRLRTERYRFDNGDTSQLDWRDAVAALDLLDNAERINNIQALADMGIYMTGDPIVLRDPELHP